jgi:hypothetical protein
MRISLVAFVRFVAFFTALVATACGDPNPGPSGPDSGVVTDAAPIPTDSGAVCGSTERNMGAPIQWRCGGADDPPNGAIRISDPPLATLEVGPMPLTPQVCGARAPGVFDNWLPWSTLQFFGQTQAAPDRFYVKPPGWTEWIRCNRIAS